MTFTSSVFFRTILGLIVAGAAVIPTGSQASFSGEGRFRPGLDQLEKWFKSSSSPAEIAKLLVTEKNGRVVVFRLEALSRLYLHIDSEFKEMHDDFKALEDRIGAYDKWTTLGKTKKAQRALDELQETIIEDNWMPESKKTSRLSEISSFLKNYRWGSESADRQTILEKVQKEFKEIEDTEWDFKILESGSGLHEFRRDMRWILLEIQVTPDVFQFRKSQSCPIKEYERLYQDPTANSKYAQLEIPPPGSRPCLISRCLLLALTKTVYDFGKLKDEAEEIGGGTSDVTPKAIRKQAEVLHEELTRLALMKTLSGELKACH